MRCRGFFLEDLGVRGFFFFFDLGCYFVFEVMFYVAFGDVFYER